MVIRCKNCYKKLHYQERYCTRCGTESEEVVEIMENGVPPVSDWQKTKVALIISFFVSFLFTGVFSVVMGILYRRFNPSLIIDEEGLLPIVLSGFSRGYSLFITSIATLLILSIVFYSDWFSDFKEYKAKDVFYSLQIWAPLIGLLYVTSKIIGFSPIPSYIFTYIENDVAPFIIIITFLILYAIVEEFFRKIVIEGINEVTIWPNYITVIISGIFSVAFNLMVFMGFENLIINGILGLTLGHLYLKNKNNLIPNIIVRIILIILVLFL